jgi:hypothetical protein
MMEVHEQEVSRPLVRRWQLVVVSVFLVFACIFGAAAYRNVQQWNVALKLRRQVEATGGEAEFMQVCGFLSALPHYAQEESWPIANFLARRSARVDS